MVFLQLKLFTIHFLLKSNENYTDVSVFCEVGKTKSKKFETYHPFESLEKNMKLINGLKEKELIKAYC